MNTTLTGHLPCFRHLLAPLIRVVGFGLLLGMLVGSWPQTALAQLSCTVTQITSATQGFSEVPSINADGTRIAFQSTANLTGSNAEGNFESFLFDTTTDTFTQITSTTGSFSGDVSINADGTRIAFVSDADLTGGNPDGNDEIFLATCDTQLSGADLALPRPTRPTPCWWAII